MVSILVTGGAGYIGAHCCQALAAAGYKPVCFDNLSTGHKHFVRWGPMIRGDVRDTQGVTAALLEHRPAAVVHLAALSLVSQSVVDPASYYDNNFVGTLSLLRAMNETGCRTLVFSSTGAVYGDVAGGLVPEAAAGQPVNPYGASKWMAEQLIADFRRAFRLRAISLRYFNVGGADGSGFIGELRDPETHLIPRAMMTLQGHVRDFAVFGTDYQTSDGTAIRDYIHVSDLAAAHVSALALLQTGHEGGSFNLGTGRGYSVREVLAAIESETGRSVPRTVKKRRTGDPSTLVADPSSARRILGFIAPKSDLPTIVRSAWKWHQCAHPVGFGDAGSASSDALSSALPADAPSLAHHQPGP